MHDTEFQGNHSLGSGEYLFKVFIIKWLHLHLSLSLEKKPSLSGSSDTLFTSMFIYKMRMSKKRGITNHL